MFAIAEFPISIIETVNVNVNLESQRKWAVARDCHITFTFTRKICSSGTQVIAKVSIYFGLDKAYSYEEKV